MNIYEEQFEIKNSNPTYWHNKASDLFSSARVLWKAMDEKSNLQVSCLSTYKMLIGMSFEVLIKAHCIAQKIDNERINKSHNLTELANIAGLNLAKKENKILNILSEYIVWDGRYPTPIKVSQMKTHNDNIRSTSYDKEKIGTLDILTPNGALDFINIQPIWRRLSGKYMDKYNQT